MAKPPSLVASALATWNGKALIKGKKDISSFDKSVKSLGKTFGKVFAGYQLLAFAKKAVNAFAADQAAAKALEVQLKNTGFAFASPYVENYIASLQKLSGVLDDNLRPAFQSLLTATRSITLSQNALNIALDVSAGTGKSLQEVTDAIVKGYNGQTKGLKTLGVGLSKAALKTGNMELALKELEKAYSGQAKARLETFAGKIDLLKVAAADATEIIGKGLVDAITALGKDKSIDNAADSMNKFALAIADTVRGLGLLVGEVKKFADTDVGKLLAGLTFLLFGSKKLVIGAALALVGMDIGKSNPAAQPNIGGYSGIPSVQERIKMQELNSRKKLIDAIKAEEALKTLKDKYDVERIGLMAALNNATDLETKTRLSEKLAILDGNAARASEYLAARNADQALVDLATSTDDAATALGKLKDWDPLSGLKPTAKDLAFLNGGGGGMSNAPSNPINTNVVNGNNSLFNQPSDAQGSNYNITLALAPNAGEFGQLVYNSFLINQKNGLAQNYAGGGL